MMLSTSATYTSGAAPVNAGASCHAATVSAEPRLDTRQPIRRNVFVTSTRGLHGISGSSLPRSSRESTAATHRHVPGALRWFRQCARGDVVPGGDAADCSAVITVTAACCGPVDTVLANNACQELRAQAAQDVLIFEQGAEFAR